MSNYGDALRQEAFGHIPLVHDNHRDEDKILQAQPRKDGAYWHMLDRCWKVQFGGTDRFETFHIEDYDGANRLFLKLQAGGQS